MIITGEKTMTINKNSQRAKLKKHALNDLKKYQHDHTAALDFKQRKEIQSVINRLKFQIKGLSKLQ